MSRIKTILSIFNDISLSICGLTLVELMTSGVYGIDLLGDIDNTIKTLAASAAFIILVITTPYRIKIMIVDLKRKRIDNQIKEIEKRTRQEELRKIQKENNVQAK